MAQAQNNAPTSLYRSRRSFAKIPAVMDAPNLIAIQTESFKWFQNEGLDEAFQDICPIESNAKNMRVEIGKHEFGEPKYTVDECRLKDVTYQAPLFAEVRFMNLETGERIKEQDASWATSRLRPRVAPSSSTGMERVVVSQLVQLARRLLRHRARQDEQRERSTPKVIPSRGAWLEFETDKRDILSVHRPQAQAAGHLAARPGPGRNARGNGGMPGRVEMVLRTLDH